MTPGGVNGSPPKPVPTPAGTPNPKGTPPGASPTDPNAPRVPAGPIPAGHRPVSVAVADPATQRRVELAKWVESAASGPQAFESRRNVYRAIVDRREMSPSLMASLGRKVGDEHQVCREFVRHVLDLRANNRLSPEQARGFLLSMLRAMGPAVNADIDAYLDALPDPHQTGGTPAYRSAMRAATLQAVHTLGEAIGLQGNPAGSKTPSILSEAWFQERKLKHLRPDTLRDSLAAHARKGLTNSQAKKYFNQGMEQGRRREGAPLAAGAQTAAVATQAGAVGAASAAGSATGSVVTPAEPTPTPKPERSDSMSSTRESKAAAGSPRPKQPENINANERHKQSAAPDRILTHPRAPSELEEWASEITTSRYVDQSGQLSELLSMESLSDEHLAWAVQYLAAFADPFKLINQWQALMEVNIGSEPDQKKALQIQTALVKALVTQNWDARYAQAYVNAAIYADLIHKKPEVTRATLHEFGQVLASTRGCEAAVEAVRGLLKDGQALLAAFNDGHGLAHSLLPPRPPPPDPIPPGSPAMARPRMRSKHRVQFVGAGLGLGQPVRDRLNELVSGPTPAPGNIGEHCAEVATALSKVNDPKTIGNAVATLATQVGTKALLSEFSIAVHKAMTDKVADERTDIVVQRFDLTIAAIILNLGHDTGLSDFLDPLLGAVAKFEVRFNVAADSIELLGKVIGTQHDRTAGEEHARTVRTLISENKKITQVQRDELLNRFNIGRAVSEKEPSASSRHDSKAAIPKTPPAGNFAANFLTKLEGGTQESLKSALTSKAKTFGAANFCDYTVAALWTHINTPGKSDLAEPWSKAVIAALEATVGLTIGPLDKNAAWRLLETLSSPSMTTQQLAAAKPFVQGLAQLMASKPELRNQLDKATATHQINSEVFRQFTTDFHTAVTAALAGKNEAPPDLDAVVKQVQDLTKEDGQLDPVFQMIVDSASNKDQFENLFNAIKGDKKDAAEKFTKYVHQNKVRRAELLAELASRFLVD